MSLQVQGQGETKHAWLNISAMGPRRSKQGGPRFKTKALAHVPASTNNKASSKVPPNPYHTLDGLREDPVSEEESDGEGSVNNGQQAEQHPRNDEMALGQTKVADSSNSQHPAQQHGDSEIGDDVEEALRNAGQDMMTLSQTKAIEDCSFRHRIEEDGGGQEAGDDVAEHAQEADQDQLQHDRVESGEASSSLGAVAEEEIPKTDDEATRPSSQEAPLNEATRTEVARRKLGSGLFNIQQAIRTSDWRVHNAEVQIARDRARIEATSTGTRRWSTQALGPRNSRGTSHADQVAGVIVWRFDERPVARQRQVTDGYTYFEAAGGRPMEKKGRYFVITGARGQVVRECPVYSNHNTGLLKTPEEKKGEYMSIKPPHVNAKDFVNQSPRNAVLDLECIKQREDNAMAVRETMVVHWMDVRERDINNSDVRIFGSLSKVSTGALLDKLKTS